MANKKVKRYSLSTSEYSKYQEDRERPRGAFAEIWTPDTSPVSLHKVRVETSAIARADKSKKAQQAPQAPAQLPEGLFLKSVD